MSPSTSTNLDGAVTRVFGAMLTAEMGPVSNLEPLALKPGRAGQ